MFIQRIESPGLAHWSYYLEDDGEAFVIDARRDVAVYADLARSRGAHITTILETHRNEDYVVGSVELAERTGALIYHADSELEYSYGTAIEHKQRLLIGSYELDALLTPGHTHGHMCYLLRESGSPWMLFSGDLLFADDVGRTDLGPEGSAVEFARELYHSLHDMVFMLDEHTIVWPAHGAGSACGSAISSRPYSTLGLERALNPLLQLEESAFVEQMVERSARIGRPPYFTRMERMNLEGSRFDERGVLPPLSPARIDELLDDGALVVDTRDAECFLAAHVPDSLAIPSSMLGAWAGWFIEADAHLILVSEDPQRDMTELSRMGFDDVHGYMGGGIAAWEVAGRTVARTHTLDTPGVCRRLDEGAVLRVLDIRTADEVEKLHIESAQHITLRELPERLDELTPEEPIVIFCGTGRRSTIAASLLERAGRESEVVLGGTAGWSSDRCPLRGVDSA